MSENIYYVYALLNPLKDFQVFRAITKANGTLSSVKYRKTVSQLVNQGLWHSSRLNNKRIKSGTHNFQGVLPWDNPRNTPLSLQTWLQASSIYDYYSKNTYLGCIKLKLKYEQEYNCLISRKTIQTLFSKYKQGWIPLEDAKWLSFHNKFKG